MSLTPPGRRQGTITAPFRGTVGGRERNSFSPPVAEAPGGEKENQNPPTGRYAVMNVRLLHPSRSFSNRPVSLPFGVCDRFLGGRGTGRPAAAGPRHPPRQERLEAARTATRRNHSPISRDRGWAGAKSLFPTRGGGARGEKKNRHPPTGRECYFEMRLCAPPPASQPPTHGPAKWGCVCALTPSGRLQGPPGGGVTRSGSCRSPCPSPA